MILDQFSLKGKVAIVTGSNTGLGQGFCVAMAEAGANVMGVSRSNSDETLQKIGPAQFAYVTADLTAIEPIEDVIQATLERYGKVDILINNAGIIRREDAIAFGEQDWDDVLAVNAKTVFFFSQAVAKRFIAQGTGGKIINVASMLSYQGGIRVPSYTAAKSAVKGLTMSLANEWAKYNINVNAIAPGYMVTNNTQQIRADKARNDAILERIPAGRWGTPDDIMGAGVFLASAASDYVNGFTLAVDGGWLGR